VDATTTSAETPGTPGAAGAAARERRWRDGPRRWHQAPLWLRLVASVLVLGALALLLNAVVGTRLLRNYMIGQVDKDLHANAQMLTQTDISRVVDAAPNIPSEYAAYELDASGEIREDVASNVYSAGARPDIPSLTYQQALGRNGRPFTVDSFDGDIRWRAVAYAWTDRVLPYEQHILVVANSLDDVDAATHRLGTINILVGLCLLGGLALAGYGIVRGSLRPLDEMEDTAVAITGGDLTRRVPDDDPATEVGRLGLAFNTMLDKIEMALRDQAASEEGAIRSEARMRQFVADASHELRTPLTSIRGFAELHRQGAVTDAGGTAELLGRIEDQATRMGTLVDDLLLLARLDQQRPLAHEPVDLVALARDVTDAAEVRDHGRSIGLDTEGDELYVLGDEQRLRQVLTNLVDNALMHTPEGTHVDVRARRQVPGQPGARAWAIVEVHDDGPGLAPEQAERVFERFYRTDAARSRARGGTGLGLSIVAAIAGAHGGRAEVDTSPGEGATFRLMLPLEPDDGDGNDVSSVVGGSGSGPAGSDDGGGDASGDDGSSSSGDDDGGGGQPGLTPSP
jgi:two-component system, OmpR family, sensor kinase